MLDFYSIKFLPWFHSRSSSTIDVAEGAKVDLPPPLKILCQYVWVLDSYLGFTAALLLSNDVAAGAKVDLTPSPPSNISASPL